MKTTTSTPQRLMLNKMLTLLIVIISLGGSVAAQTSGQKCFTAGNPGCQSCLVGYPDNTNLPRSAVVFNESEALAAAEPGPTTCGAAPTSIKLWYTDEHAMTLGIRQVIVKNANGTTTTTNYPITPAPTTPTCVSNPILGTTAQSGDQSGNDEAAGGGRPIWPVLYITDLTVNGNSSRAGDWQQGGTGIAPSRVCGLWKAAVRTVDYTHNPAVVTITPDADQQTKNHQNYGGGDAPPAGTPDGGYGAEVSWDVASLNLIPGHSYRLEFMVHDGDQNKSGGDVGEACTTIVMPGGVVNPPIATATTTWTSDNTAHTITFHTVLAKTFIDNTYGTNAIGYPPAGHSFSDFVNGDYLQMALYDANGSKKLEFQQDYFSASNTVSSGYKSLGVVAGDGSMITGDHNKILSFKTSMDQNFNTNNYVLTTNSPATTSSYNQNPTYPNWDYNVWYDVTVKQDAFGGAGFGDVQLPLVHANHNKTGDDEFSFNAVDCPNGTLTLGDQVWDDKNLNGVRDFGEPGVYGATVNLYLDANNDNVPDGAAIATTVTDANGMYKFTGLPAGNYIVGVVLPYNTSLVPTNGGDPDNNINNDNNGVSVVNGEARSLSITLALGTEPTNDGDDANGNLTLDFALVQNFGAIGDFVWDDQNQNGKQDLGEPGLRNVIVKLYTCAGTLVQTTATDSLGEYGFINVPTLITGTSYKVQFSNLPQGYTFTFKNKAGVAPDQNSDVNQGTGFTDCFLLHSGEFNNDIDAGAFNPGSPLPVTLVGFSGKYADGVSHLYWSTSQEYNLKSFEIERSVDGVFFYSNGLVSATGTSSSINNYLYNDRLPVTGANYYRLKVVDVNGAYRYSNVVLLNVQVKGISVTGVYPNPFADKVQVNVVAESAQPVIVKLTDYVGRTIRTITFPAQAGANNFTVGQLSTLPRGMYMVQVQAGNDILTTKLIKQ